MAIAPPCTASAGPVGVMDGPPATTEIDPPCTAPVMAGGPMVANCAMKPATLALEPVMMLGVVGVLLHAMDPARAASAATALTRIMNSSSSDRAGSALPYYRRSPASGRLAPNSR